MADIAGFGGQFASGNDLVFNANEWSATVDIDNIEVPAAFGEKWHGHALGAGRVTGTVTGKVAYNASNTAPIPLPTATGNTQSFSALGFEGTATLTATTGCTLYGTFIFHNVVLRRPHSGYMEITANFANSGSDVIMNAWDETP